MTGIRSAACGQQTRETPATCCWSLMLAVAVLTITMLGVARNYRRSILRDREVEMIHRGEQYARAVKRFYKKNGRYPTSIEQLENTNKIRYLRKTIQRSDVSGRNVEARSSHRHRQAKAG